MKQKHDRKNVPQPASSDAITRRRLKKFNDQLQERPELLTQFESILGIAADATASATQAKPPDDRLAGRWCVISRSRIQCPTTPPHPR